MAYRDVTNPGYIPGQIFDRVIREKFQDNANDACVRDQAIKFLELFRGSSCKEQVLVDILHAVQSSGRQVPERVAEIGFVMGLQFGFELALSCPPIPQE